MTGSRGSISIISTPFELKRLFTAAYSHIGRIITKRPLLEPTPFGSPITRQKCFTTIGRWGEAGKKGQAQPGRPRGQALGHWGHVLSFGQLATRNPEREKRLAKRRLTCKALWVRMLGWPGRCAFNGLEDATMSLPAATNARKSSGMIPTTFISWNC